MILPPCLLACVAVLRSLARVVLFLLPGFTAAFASLFLSLLSRSSRLLLAPSVSLRGSQSCLFVVVRIFPVDDRVGLCPVWFFCYLFEPFRCALSLPWPLLWFFL